MRVVRVGGVVGEGVVVARKMEVDAVAVIR
jgi:hypothetical protein